MKLLSQLEDLMKKGWEIRFFPHKEKFYTFKGNTSHEIHADNLDELIDKINSGPPTK